MDISSLRDRIRAAGASQSKKEQRPAAGIRIDESDTPADGGWYDLPAQGLRRMGIEAEDAEIEQMLFLDTETTGLSGGVGTVAFLVGLGWVRGGQFHTRQILMRDYASECMLLEDVARIAEPFAWVVTFNGKTFDLPLLHTRFLMNRMEDGLEELAGIDLLAPSRRLWRRRLKSVRLTNLEEKILHLERDNDLPGSEAPQRYFDYLKTRDEGPLEEVIEHNRQDVITMASLLKELCDAYACPKKLTESADQLSMALTLGRAGEKEEAESLYRMASEPRSSIGIAALKEGRFRVQARRELDQLLRRQGRTDERIELLEGMCRANEGGAYPYIELSKIAEHTLADRRAALRYAERALRACDAEEKETIEKRTERLRKRLRTEREE